MTRVVRFALLASLLLCPLDAAAQTTVNAPLAADTNLCTGTAANATAATQNFGGSTGNQFHKTLGFGFDQADITENYGYAFPLG